MKKAIAFILVLSLSAALFTIAAGAEDIPECKFEGNNLSGIVTGEGGSVNIYIKSNTGEIPDYIKAGELSDMLLDEEDRGYFKDYLASLGDVYIPVSFIKIDDFTIDRERTPSSVRVFVDYEPVFFDRIPQIEDGRILLPLRQVFEALGAKVDWNAESNTVTAERNDISVSLTVGSDKMMVNGNEVTIDVPAKIFDGRTLIPIRAVSEAFGLEVSWYDEFRAVYITS